MKIYEILQIIPVHLPGMYATGNSDCLPYYYTTAAYTSHLTTPCWSPLLITSIGVGQNFICNVKQKTPYNSTQCIPDLILHVLQWCKLVSFALLIVQFNATTMFHTLDCYSELYVGQTLQQVDPGIELDTSWSVVAYANH